MASYLEKISDLLPQDRREEWMNLASSHKAVFHEGDELMLMIWTLALIGENMGGKSALVVEAIERWETEREGLTTERLTELVGGIALGIEEKAPSFKDLKTVTHELGTTARLLGKNQASTTPISPFAILAIVLMAGVFSGLATFAVQWIKKPDHDREQRLKSSIPATENFFAIIHGRGGEVEADGNRLIIKGTPVEVEQGESQTTIRFK